MSHRIEYTQLLAGASAPGADRRLADTLRTAFIDRGAEELAEFADEHGDRITITSEGKPMTVAQVQAELQILVLGE